MSIASRGVYEVVKYGHNGICNTFATITLRVVPAYLAYQKRTGILIKDTSKHSLKYYRILP